MQRLRQAQRRDTGLPFVDIIADTVGAEEPVIVDGAGHPLHPNAAAAAAFAAEDGGARPGGHGGQLGGGGAKGWQGVSDRDALDEA